MSRLIVSSTQYASIPGKTFSTSYTYDGNSNRQTMFDADSGLTNYYYDGLNRLTNIQDFNQNSFGFSYDDIDRRTSLTRPNGFNTTYSYKSNTDFLESVLHQSSTPGPPGRTRCAQPCDGDSYTYDAVGNRLSKTLAASSLDALVYTYDNIYQLNTVQNPNIKMPICLVCTPPSYTYDAVGNRLTDLNGANYIYNNPWNRLDSAGDTSYSYDADGNRKTKVDSTGTTTYYWDPENRLAAVALPNNGGILYFTYDPFGRRIQKRLYQNGVFTTTTNYLYDGANVIEEVDQNGNQVAKYSQGPGIDQPLTITQGGVTSYYQADGLGSISSLTNSEGGITDTYTYDSFGTLTASSGATNNPYLYAGRQYDFETGLYYYRARYYDSSTGRFISEDPSRFGGGINFYRYAGNSPVDLVDPAGTTTTVYTLGGRMGGVAAGMGEGFNPLGHSSIRINNGKGDWVYSFDQDSDGNLTLYKIEWGKYFYNPDDPENPGVFDYAPNRTVFFQDLRWETGGKEETAVQDYLENFLATQGKHGKFGTASSNCATNAAKALRAGGLRVQANLPGELFEELDLLDAVKRTGYFTRTHGRILPPVPPPMY
jgi:RHS repeat-associated protein